MSIYSGSVRIPVEVLQALSEHTGIFWSSWEMEPVICKAIHAWMNPAPPPQQQAQEAARASGEAGYQWKQLFLPEGTRLRASFGGQHDFAVVTGSEIQHNEQPISPSRFANLRGSGNRNAWKAVWLRFPGGEQWLLADTCRATQKALISRLFQPAAQVPAPLASLASPAMVLPAPPQMNEGKPNKGSKAHKRHGRRARRAKKHQ